MIKPVPTVLCYGDSNTHGTRPMRAFWDVDRFPKKRRWPGVVQNKFADRVDIIEAGHPGRTTLFDNPTAGGNRNGLTSLGIYLESHCPIDAVVLMLGTNDLHAHYGLCPQVIAWNLAKLIELIQRTPCSRTSAQPPHILIISPPQVFEQGFAADAMAGAGEKSQGLAPCFEDLAKHYGADFLDAAALVSPDPLDGIHLNDESHITLGMAVADKLIKPLALDG